MIIDILMLTDCNFVSQVKVTMFSICENTNQKLSFTILCDEYLDQKSRNRIIMLKRTFPNIEIRFHEVDLKDFKNAKPNPRIPIVAYYRLIAANVVNAKKAIYLDADLIVNMDIKELYDIDIGQYYIAGVRDLYPIMCPNFALWYADNYNVKSFSDYINSGVMLMNLELIRKDAMVNKFLAGMEEKNLWVDQDVLNRVCHGRICLIDWRFNHTAAYSDEDYKRNYKESIRKKSNEIIHFCGSNKPWRNLTLSYVDVWWKTAKKVLENEIYEKLYKAALVGNDFNKMIEIFESKCFEVKTIIIVGYSDLGVMVKNNLLKHGVVSNIIFCDNNPNKRTLMLTEQKIYSPEELVKKYKNAMWINVVQEKRNEVVEQLSRLGISDEQIINYANI